MSLFVPTRFVWRFGGLQVHLCGSFTRWVETVPMQPVEGHPGVFQVIVSLPPGYHQYKFIVDGEWRHDETQPFMPDPLGNVNNWLFVQKRDEPAGPSGVAAFGHVPLQQPQSIQQQQQQQQQQLQQQQQQQAAAAAQAAQLAAQQAQLLGVAVTTPSASLRPSLGADGYAMDSAAASTSTSAPAAPQAANSSVSVDVVQDEPAYSLKKIREFLNSHTAYELIPESGKVVLLDIQLPIRQAFHALAEQGISSAPLWDPVERTIVGMISASDFIDTLSRLRNSVTQAGGNLMTEAEMDEHTIRELLDQHAAEGRQPRDLVYVTPRDTLSAVVHRLLDHSMWVTPVVSCDPKNSRGEVPQLLAHATLSSVLAVLLRHFRASLASLPLLSQQVGELPLGTWIASVPATPVSLEEARKAERVLGHKGGRPRGRKVLERLITVSMLTPITTALNILFETGLSSLPVVDDRGSLIDIFARGDITLLAKNNAYYQLQHEDIPVGHVLSLARPEAALQHLRNTPPGSTHPSTSSLGGLSQMLAGMGHSGGGSNSHLGHAAAFPGTGSALVSHRALQGSATGSVTDMHGSWPASSTPKQRVFTCSRRDTLRTVVEKLSIPGIRRLVVVNPENHNAVEGILSLCDVAAFLLS